MKTYEILDENGNVLSLQEMADNLSPALLFRQRSRVKYVNGLPTSAPTPSAAVGRISITTPVLDLSKSPSLVVQPLAALPGGIQPGDVALTYRPGIGMFVDNTIYNDAANFSTTSTATKRIVFRDKSTLIMRNGSYLARR